MQMKRYNTAFAAIMFFGVLVGFASAQTGYVTPTTPMAEEISIPPNRVDQIEVDDKEGTITFQDSFAAKHTFRRVQYRRIYTPMPRDVVPVKRAFFMLEMDEVIKKAAAVSQRSKWLGWGAYVAYFHAMALIEKKDFDEANKVLKEAALRYAKHEGLEAVIRGAQSELVYAMSGGKLITTGKPSSLTAKLNGIALQRENKTREAILEYMKAITLYPVITKKPEEGTDPETLRDLTRTATYVRLVSLLSLKQIGDKSTAGMFAQELKNEYRLQ